MSTPGGGTSRATPVPEAARPRSTEPAPNAPTVLVVDDEAANVASLERIFKREGFRVLTGSGAKEALAIARSHRVEVVLTDLMMPGVSGLELLKALRQVLPDTEVVLMTAYGLSLIHISEPTRPY